MGTRAQKREREGGARHEATARHALMATLSLGVGPGDDAGRSEDTRRRHAAGAQSAQRASMPRIRRRNHDKRAQRFRRSHTHAVRDACRRVRECRQQRMAELRSHGEESVVAAAAQGVGTKEATEAADGDLEEGHVASALDALWERL
jgi:hypothetical protein